MLAVATKNIVTEFAETVKSGNLQHLHHLLDDSGEFTIQDDFTLEDRDTNKTEFIQWLDKRIQMMKKRNRKIQYQLDQCMFCAVGEPVVIFNGGKFPRFPNSTMDKEKMGLRIKAKDGMIIETSLCHVFVRNKNPFIVDLQLKLVHNYCKSGMKWCDAWQKADIEIGEKHLKWL